VYMWMPLAALSRKTQVSHALPLHTTTSPGRAAAEGFATTRPLDRTRGMRNASRGECHGKFAIRGLPYLNNPHTSGPIQWACGDVEQKEALPRRAPRMIRHSRCTEGK